MISLTQLCWRYHSLPLSQHYITIWNKIYVVCVGGSCHVYLRSLSLFTTIDWLPVSAELWMNGTACHNHIENCAIATVLFDLTVESSAVVRARLNIKTILSELGIIKMRQLWDNRLCNGNPYTGKTTSLYPDRPSSPYTMIQYNIITFSTTAIGHDFEFPEVR